MTDFPSGRWSPLLVGHQWPGSQSVGLLATSAQNRTSTASLLETYANTLQAARSGPISPQQGLTADTIRRAFQLGEAHCRDLGMKNKEKGQAYLTARNSVTCLQDELKSIAETGNRAINAIETSDKPVAIKVSEISAAVVDAQTRANSKAADYCANLLTSIQKILDQAGTGSATQFGASNGVSLDRFGTPNTDSVRLQVTALLGETAAQPVSTQRSLFSSGQDQVASDQVANTPLTTQGNTSLRTSEDHLAQRSQVAWSQTPPRDAATIFNSGQDHLGSAHAPARPIAPIPSQTSFGPATSSTATAPTLTPLSPNLEATTPSIPNTPTALDLPQLLSPNAQPGTSTSPAAEALSNTALDTKHHTPLQVAPISAQAIPSTPVFEAAHATAPPPDVQPITHAPMVQPVATAAPPIQPSTIGATPTVAPSNLPGYGADVRPAVATPSHAPTPAMPTSAPTTSHNSGAHTPSGVVRQQPTEREPVALAEKAYAAKSTGATAAATAQKVAATKRLKDLLAAVVQQEPKLRWAIGDHSNGTTVIATDIAFGWIPPHVEIPAGLRLIQPQSTARSLDALLTGTSGRETFEPGQPKPWADKPQMSTRARETKQPEDLSWSLIQATKWRDGLPRLAHTLAKAATAKTGYLDSEVELLHQHLNRTAQEALDEYPHTSPIAIGNWQLLACIAALIDNEITCANYHLAWFEHSHAKQNT